MLKWFQRVSLSDSLHFVFIFVIDLVSDLEWDGWWCDVNWVVGEGTGDAVGSESCRQALNKPSSAPLTERWLWWDFSGFSGDQYKRCSDTTNRHWPQSQQRHPETSSVVMWKDSSHGKSYRINLRCLKVVYYMIKVDFLKLKINYFKEEIAFLSM